MSQNMSPLKIAIAGLGVVGGEVARQLMCRQEQLALASGRALQLVAVSALSAGADRGFSMARIDWHNNAIDLASRDDVDVIIEMIGGSEGVALDLARAALGSGKHVVTANKAMIAHHGAELAQLAEANNTSGDTPILTKIAAAKSTTVAKVAESVIASNKTFVDKSLALYDAMVVLKQKFTNCATIEELNVLWETYLGVPMPQQQAIDLGNVEADGFTPLPIKSGLQF